MASVQQHLIDKFESRNARVAIVGLGYVGLPLALSFVDAGYEVVGIDLDARKVEMINRGQSYIGDVPSAEVAAAVTRQQAAAAVHAQTGANNAGAGSALPGAEPRGWLRATADYSVLATCDAVSICVPTPLRKTGDPDMSHILSATQSIARYLHAGMLVVLESTTYPGTTEEVVLPILAGKPDVRASSPSPALQVGEDFFLAFSPERVDPGRTDYVTRNTPKVIGGMTPACTDVASAYYGPAIDTLVPVSSPAAAEMTKIFENTFRAVNIALANELLLMCDKLNLDAWEVLDAAATKPFGFMKFTPGPGLGGHCIPIDPQYLSWKLRTLEYKARFIELATEINTSMPPYWVQKVQDALNNHSKAVKGSHILVLGVAYKRDVNDLRESPALDIIHLLARKGARVEYHDPYVPALQLDEIELSSSADLDTALRAADCVVVATDHTDYDWEHVHSLASLIVDTRHVMHEHGG